MDLPERYVVIHINGIRVYAGKECYEILRQGMIDRKSVEFVDVEGEYNVVNCRYVDLMWISTAKSREIGRAHSQMIDDESPTKEEWEKD